MADAIRPDEQAFKAMYERGYRTWSGLHKKAIANIDADPQPWSGCLLRPENAFKHYPRLPQNLIASKSTVAEGISTWRTTEGCCDLPPFNQEFLIWVATVNPAIITVSEPDQSTFLLSRRIDGDSDHTVLLFLAWAYILSARWAETMHGLSGPTYTEFEAEWEDKTVTLENDSTISATINIELGDITEDAGRWWAAVLAFEGGWKTTLSDDDFHSPWYTKLQSKHRFTLSRSTKSRPCPAQYHAPSFATALSYLSEYCKLHHVADQSHAALAAALFLPAAKFSYRNTFKLPTPRFCPKVGSKKEPNHNNLVWSENLDQLDRLLALSCNPVGMKSLLTSVFFEPGVESNICGAWLQGSFAFLDSDVAKDQQVMLQIFSKRDPSLGFLWLGASVLGEQTRFVQECRRVGFNTEINAGAWTGTVMSFIQEPVSNIPPEGDEITRADECRLTFLSYSQSHAFTCSPPLFSFAPFGSTAISDTSLDVHEHAR